MFETPAGIALLQHVIAVACFIFFVLRPLYMRLVGPLVPELKQSKEEKLRLYKMGKKAKKNQQCHTK
jgi:hypothetical protein